MAAALRTVSQRARVGAGRWVKWWKPSVTSLNIV